MKTLLYFARNILVILFGAAFVIGGGYLMALGLYLAMAGSSLVAVLLVVVGLVVVVSCNLLVDQILSYGTRTIEPVKAYDFCESCAEEWPVLSRHEQMNADQ